MAEARPGVDEQMEELDEERRQKILEELERHHRRYRALQVLRQAARYVEGYLKDYRLNIEANFQAENPWVKVTVILKEDE